MNGKSLRILHIHYNYIYIKTQNLCQDLDFSDDECY